jgi:4-hydroxy-tetrahydrodipicolinate synthase
LIEQIGDPNLSLILYHFPALSGVPITAGLIRILLRRFPDNITGIKDSTAELGSALQFRQAFPELSILPGGDPLLLPLLDQGGGGCITAIANVASPLLRRIWDCHDQPSRRREAEAAHEIVCELRDVLSGPDLLARVKAVIGMLRNDQAWAQVRLPLRALDQTALQELGETLAPILERMQTVVAESAAADSVPAAEPLSH